VDVMRFSRQMLVPGVGRDGQLALARSSVLVVGCGGIGSSVILYLAGAGVPLTLVDHDTVETSNLHRQVAHDARALGENKAESAARRARELHDNGLQVHAVPEKLTAANVRSLVAAVHLVVDATDNAEARYLLNDACVLEGRALLSGSAVGLEGQLTLYDFRRQPPPDSKEEVSARASAAPPPPRGPCYRCMYPSPEAVLSCRSCADAGVIGPVPGLVGCLQAVEAIKFLLLREAGAPAAAAATKAGLCSMQGQLMYDAFSGQFHSFVLPPRKADCAVCGDWPHIACMADSAASLHVPGRACVSGSSCVGENASAAAEPVPEVTAAAYSAVRRAGTPHLLLDVRSAVQFGVVHLHTPHEVGVGRQQQQQLLHMPLALLQGRGEKTGGGSQEERSRAAVLQVQKARSLLHQKKEEEGEGDGAACVYVLCRRGVDSVVATRLLRDGGLQAVFNVRGGLRGWSEEVDPQFPVY